MESIHTAASYTKNQLAEMREWVSDCAGDLQDLDVISEMTDAEITAWVARNYDGGLPAFIRALS